MAQLQRIAITSLSSANALSQLQENQILLTPQQQHYLSRVLRLQKGDRFIAMDGMGKWWLAQLQGEEAQILELLTVKTELPVSITLMVALPKGNGFDEVWILPSNPAIIKIFRSLLYIDDMTQLSHPRRTRILPPSPIAASEKNRRTEQRDALAKRCRLIFERLRPQLIEAHYNWHIAIDPDTEQYLLDPTLKGITQKIREVYGNTSEVKLTIFRLNDTGTCGRLWV